MIITLNGYPGSGKSTVGKLLATRLNIKRYAMGDLRRDAAEERGMTLEAWNTLGETSPETDLYVEEKVKQLGRGEDHFLLDSRTAFHYIPNSVKIFLTVDPKEGARRIFEDIQAGARDEQNPYTSIKEVVEANAERTESDNRRYQKYYGFRWDNLEAYDHVIDTTFIPPEKVVDQIIEAIHI